MKAGDLSGCHRQTWVVLIGGFTQKTYADNGLQRLWIALNRHSRPMVHIAFREWSFSYRRLAERIFHVSRFDNLPPQVVVVGYSYGGQTALNFCRQLKRRGIEVEHLVLCDAVRRWISRIPTPSSLLRFWSLRVPDNVRSVRYFIQRVNHPRGHRVVLDDSGKTLFWNNEKNGYDLQVAHEYCDDHTVFQNHVLAQYSKVLSNEK